MRKICLMPPLMMVVEGQKKMIFISSALYGNAS
jgi:hypothetical protein